MRPSPWADRLLALLVRFVGLVILLATLAAHGYASRLPNRRYTLGVRSLRLATAWVDRLLQLAGPIMARVADRCGETVYLLQLVGAEAVTLAQLTGMDFRFTALREDFADDGNAMGFDPVGQRALFAEGVRVGLSGDGWRADPPGFGTDRVADGVRGRYLREEMDPCRRS